MEIIAKSVDLTCGILDNNMHRGDDHATEGELILYKSDTGLYQLQFVHIGMSKRIANTVIESIPAAGDAMTGMAKKAGVAAAKIAIKVTTGTRVSPHAGREIGNDDLQEAKQKFEQLRQSNYNMDNTNFRKTTLSLFRKSEINKTVFARLFVNGGSVGSSKILCIYDKKAEKGFLITNPNALALKKWVDFFNLQNQPIADFTIGSFHAFRRSVFKETQKTCLIKFVRRKKWGGGMRDYAVRIDGGQAYVLANGASFELAVSEGNHTIEVANKAILSRDTDWSESNCIISREFRFDINDKLLLDLTWNEERSKWGRI